MPSGWQVGRITAATIFIITTTIFVTCLLGQIGISWHKVIAGGTARLYWNNKRVIEQLERYTCIFLCIYVIIVAGQSISRTKKYRDIGANSARYWALLAAATCSLGSLMEYAGTIASLYRYRTLHLTNEWISICITILGAFLCIVTFIKHEFPPGSASKIGFYTLLILSLMATIGVAFSASIRVLTIMHAIPASTSLRNSFLALYSVSLLLLAVQLVAMGVVLLAKSLCGPTGITVVDRETCVGCGYDVRGIKATVCPECGRNQLGSRPCVQT